jgi:uncharacterized protein
MRRHSTLAPRRINVQSWPCEICSGRSMNGIWQGMLKQITGIVLLAAVTASLSHASSFDCKRASTAVEKLICNDPDLSRLDSELHARYRERLSAGAPGLVEEQRGWLAKRNACNNTACIKIHYLDRISEVAERGKSLADIAARLEIPKYEKDRQFCPQLLDHLKRWQDVAVVAPVVTADSIDAPALRDRLGSCDPRKFTEHYVIEPRVWSASNLDAMSEEERNDYGIGYVMRSGFRLYEMNIDPDSGSGTELVLYGASVRQIDGDPLETGFGSSFKVIDTKQCRVTDEHSVSDVINRLDTFVGVLEFAGKRHLFDASHYAFESLWGITFRLAEAAGSAQLARSCRFIAKDEKPVPVGTPVGPRRPADPGYGDIRIEVPVRKAARVSTSAPRPANFYQLAGNAGGQACHDSLAVLNRPGTYSGDDVTRWLLDSPQQIEFRSLEAGAAPYVFPGLEYASVDINTDGRAEHVYRLNSVLRGQRHQDLMVVPYPLQNPPELLSARVPDQGPDEWAFTRNDIWAHITDDTLSQRLIFPHDPDRVERNVGLSNGVYWSLYQKYSSVIAVSAPIHDFATPELLVFAPREQQSGVLLCVIMPVAWHN